MKNSNVVKTLKTIIVLILIMNGFVAMTQTITSPKNSIQLGLSVPNNKVSLTYEKVITGRKSFVFYAAHENNSLTDQPADGVSNIEVQNSRFFFIGMIGEDPINTRYVYQYSNTQVGAAYKAYSNELKDQNLSGRFSLETGLSIARYSYQAKSIVYDLTSNENDFRIEGLGISGSTDYYTETIYNTAINGLSANVNLGLAYQLMIMKKVSISIGGGMNVRLPKMKTSGFEYEGIDMSDLIFFDAGLKIGYWF